MQFSNLSKTLAAAAVVGLASMGASTAFAQMAPQSVDMTVTGTIVPASCSAAFSDGGEVDFGSIRLIDLPDNAYYRIPGTKDVTLNVTCNAGKRVTFTVADAQTSNAIADPAMYTALGSSAAAGYVYGLGTATVGGSPVNLGSYAIRMQAPTATVSGTSAARAAITSANGGATWGAAGWVLKGTQMYSAGTTTAAVITNGTAFQFPLQISAALNYGSRLQVSDETKLNGQAVFAISYQ